MLEIHLCYKVDDYDDDDNAYYALRITFLTDFYRICMPGPAFELPCWTLYEYCHYPIPM